MQLEIRYFPFCLEVRMPFANAYEEKQAWAALGWMGRNNE